MRRLGTKFISPGQENNQVVIYKNDAQSSILIKTIRFTNTNTDGSSVFFDCLLCLTTEFDNLENSVGYDIEIEAGNPVNLKADDRKVGEEGFLLLPGYEFRCFFYQPNVAITIFGN